MKKSTVIVMWGLITSVLMSLFSFFLSYTGNTSNKALSYLGFIIMFGGMLIGMIQFRDKVNGGFGSFGQLYTLGILIVCVIAVATTVYFAVYLQLNPGFIDKIRQQAEADMVNKGMSSDQMEMGMKMMEKFTSPTAMMVFGLLGNVFFGAILGLVAAAISSKNKPFMEEDNNTLQS